ncbi:MAG: GGDEF domain-containing protein [Thermodesulfobacteriota bacterium]
MHAAKNIRKNVVDLAITHKNSSPLPLVSLSPGVATSTDTSPICHEDLIRFADKALYKAKRKGQNRVEAFVEI